MNGIFISLEGDNVRYTSRDRRQFDSNDSFPKIAVKETGVVLATDEVTVSHRLGYLPMTLVFYEDENGNLARSYMVNNGAGSSQTNNILIRNLDTSDRKYYLYIMANEVK